MPRSSPIPARDLAIGGRITQARKELMVPRTSMALKLGLSTDRLISYEFGRVKLPWSVGWQLCLVFGVNPIWLATGDGDMWGGIGGIDQRLVDALGDRPLFTEVVDELIGPIEKGHRFSARVQRIFDEIVARDRREKATVQIPSARKPNGPFLSPVQAEAWNSVAFGALRVAFGSVRPDQLSEFTRAIDEAIASVIGQHHGRRK